MTLLGRQLPSQGGLFRGFGQACGPRQVRPLTSRPLARRTANKRLCTDATLAHDTPESALPQRLDTEALLLRRYKAHDAAVTATLVLDDKGDTKEVVTASLDKSLALWRLQDASLPDSVPSTSGLSETVRLTTEIGPVFSLVADATALGDNHNQIFCGNLAKSIEAWEPPDDHLIPKVHLNSHTGWVRGLATSTRWLFSCSCNVLCQWDMARAVPRKVREVKLFTGDILGLCTGRNRVFACTSNGAIRALNVSNMEELTKLDHIHFVSCTDQLDNGRYTGSWDISKKGELTEAAVREKAHKDRVTAILWKKGFLYSVSYDGFVKMWDASSLELVQEVKKAHDGQRVQCAAAGPDNFLYTGGDDKLVRRWELGSLNPSKDDTLHCHNYAVRSLSAGRKDVLVSGDSSGEIAVWKVQSC